MNLITFSHLINQNPIMVVDYYADWCEPCKKIAPHFERLSLKFPNVKFVKVNVDECNDICAQFGIRSLPTFQVFYEGKIVAESKGAKLKKVARTVLKCVNQLKRLA